MAAALNRAPCPFQAAVVHVGPEEGDVTPETTSTNLEEVRPVNWARTRTLACHRYGLDLKLTQKYFIKSLVTNSDKVHFVYFVQS